MIRITAPDLDLYSLRAREWIHRNAFSLLLAVSICQSVVLWQVGGLAAQNHRFAVSDCGFQGVRTPNILTRLTIDEQHKRKLASILTSRNLPGTAAEWNAWADDDKAYRASIIAAGVLDNCGPIPTSPPDLHYLMSPQPRVAMQKGA